MTVLLLFPLGFLLFIFLLWLPRWGFPKLHWMIVARVDIFDLFLILEKMLQFFTIKNDVYCGFVVYGSYYVEVGSLYAHLLKSSLKNHKLTFSASIEMIIWFLFFNMLMWCITLICRCWKVLASLGWIPLDHQRGLLMTDLFLAFHCLMTQKADTLYDIFNVLLDTDC